MFGNPEEHPAVDRESFEQSYQAATRHLDTPEGPLTSTEFKLAAAAIAIALATWASGVMGKDPSSSDVDRSNAAPISTLDSEDRYDQAP